MPTQLSPHFTLEELTVSRTAVVRGIANLPDQKQLDHLILLCKTLERVRAELGGKPLIITSGFRSEALNDAVHGAAKSAHLHGLGVDFICPAFGSVFQICQRLGVALNAGKFDEIDQLIYEGAWVHIGLDLPGKKPRKECLTARFAAGKPTQYLKGFFHESPAI